MLQFHRNRVVTEYVRHLNAIKEQKNVHLADISKLNTWDTLHFTAPE